MTSTDPAKALARNLSSLERRLNAVERGTQLANSSLVVDGATVTVPETVRTGKQAQETATVALGTANGKNAVTYSPNAPSGEGTTAGDIWFRLTDGVVVGAWEWTGTAWELHTFGDSVLDSLTVGKLVAGEIAAGQKIIAGPEFGTHAEMAADGFRVFKDDPVDGIPNEVVRMGTQTNDFIGVVSETGELLASIDDTGQGNFQSLNITGDAHFEGKTLNTIIEENGTGAVGYFEAFPPNATGGGFYGPIRDRVGVAEVNGMLKAGRRYELSWKATWEALTDWDEARFTMTYTAAPANDPQNAPNVLTTSSAVDQWVFTEPLAGRWLTADGTTTFVPTTDGRHRFLLTVERGSGTGDVYLVSANKITMTIDDTGPAHPVAGALNQGGGQLYQGPPPPPPPPPTQQYYVDLGTVGKGSWRGDGTPRTDLGGAEVVQGWDPSGFNGDGRGTYFWDLPDITGTVDRVDLYLYCSHWYYNSGGTAILNISDARGGTPDPHRFRDNWYVGGYPKPGGKTVTLPADWYPFFRGTGNAIYNGRATTIVLGPGYGTDLNYYGRFGEARLRIWYTQ